MPIADASVQVSIAFAPLDIKLVLALLNADRYVNFKNSTKEWIETCYFEIKIIKNFLQRSTAASQGHFLLTAHLHSDSIHVLSALASSKLLHPPLSARLYNSSILPRDAMLHAVVRRLSVCLR